jgi:Ca2+-binding RTX toxin-like protein
VDLLFVQFQYFNLLSSVPGFWRFLMSEVITPPGTTEPVFGLQIFTESNVFVTQLPDGTVSVFQPVPPPGVDPDVTIIAENPLDTTNYFIVTDGDDLVITAAGDDDIFTTLGDDIVYAGIGDDTVFGGVGDDRLFGGSGDDALFGGGGEDFIRGGAGNDEIDGGAGNDNLFGGAGNDRIVGGAGDDAMQGGDGNDTLVAGRGSDVMTGGKGSDRFQLSRTATVGLDRVTDFNPDEDIIEISRALLPASNLRPGRLEESDFDVVGKLGSGVTAKIVYESSTGLIYYNPGRNGSSPVALLEVEKNLTVAADAFRIIG